MVSGCRFGFFVLSFDFGQKVTNPSGGRGTQHQFILTPRGTLNGLSEKGKPIARSGRKATGLTETAGLPKNNRPFNEPLIAFAVACEDLSVTGESP